MVKKNLLPVSLAWLLALGLLSTQAGAEEKSGSAPAQGAEGKPSIAKLCTNCHEAEPGTLRGNFESVAYKNQAIQIKIDESTQIVKFDKATLKTLNIQGDPANPDEPLRTLKKGKEIRIAYTEKDGVKYASQVTAKPAIKVAPEKLVTTAEVEQMVALGPDKGGYLLIDARPAPRFQEGAIPTAINIPFPAFDKMIDKLPQDKAARIIYYCAGFT